MPNITKYVHIPTIASTLKCVRSGDILTFAISDLDNDVETTKSGGIKLHIFIENATSRPPRRKQLFVVMNKPTKIKKFDMKNQNPCAIMSTKSTVLNDIVTDAANINSDQITIKCTPEAIYFSSTKDKAAGMCQDFNSDDADIKSR